MSPVRDLIERSVSFRYGYNMKCVQRGGVTALSAADGVHVLHVTCRNGNGFLADSTRRAR
jgi:hypothetical protein